MAYVKNALVIPGFHELDLSRVEPLEKPAHHDGRFIGVHVRDEKGRRAVIRYHGYVNFALGIWIGIELEDGGGRNDGSVKECRYFTCAQGHGRFIKPERVFLDDGTVDYEIIRESKAMEAAAVEARNDMEMDPMLPASLEASDDTPDTDNDACADEGDDAEQPSNEPALVQPPAKLLQRTSSDQKVSFASSAKHNDSDDERRREAFRKKSQEKAKSFQSLSTREKPSAKRIPSISRSQSDVFGRDHRVVLGAEDLPKKQGFVQKWEVGKLPAFSKFKQKFILLTQDSCLHIGSSLADCQTQKDGLSLRGVVVATDIAVHPKVEAKITMQPFTVLTILSNMRQPLPDRTLFMFDRTSPHAKNWLRALEQHVDFLNEQLWKLLTFEDIPPALSGVCNGKAVHSSWLRYCPPGAPWNPQYFVLCDHSIYVLPYMPTFAEEAHSSLLRIPLLGSEFAGPGDYRALDGDGDLFALKDGMGREHLFRAWSPSHAQKWSHKIQHTLWDALDAAMLKGTLEFAGTVDGKIHVLLLERTQLHMFAVKTKDQEKKRVATISYAKLKSYTVGEAPLTSPGSEPSLAIILHVPEEGDTVFATSSAIPLSHCLHELLRREERSTRAVQLITP